MPNGARKVAMATATAIITMTITTLGLSPAGAAPLDCQKVRTATEAQAVGCLPQLRLLAEEAARTATEADEVYNQARIDAAAEQERAKTAALTADRAQARAAVSRSRAALVTAQLVHGGGSVGRTTEVLLSGDGASEVLYHLSRMNELTEDSAQLSEAAARDSRAAETLQARAAATAERSQAEAAETEAAYEKAKTTAETAITLVQQTELAKDATISSGTRSVLQAAFVDLPADAPTAAKVLAFARAQLGEPYVFGGAGPTTWDCSGLTMMAFQSAGIEIGGHGATVQYTTGGGRGLMVPYSQAQPGDLLFWGSGGDMAHVAIYSGGGNMIEAPRPGASVREVPVRTDGMAPTVARFTG